MGNGEYESTYIMQELQNRLQGHNLDYQGPKSMAKFLHGVIRGSSYSKTLSELQDLSCTKGKEQDSNALAKTARAFHRNLVFVGCSIPVWIPRPPLV